MQDLTEFINNSELNRNNLPMDKKPKARELEGYTSIRPIAESRFEQIPERLDDRSLDFYSGEDREHKIAANQSTAELLGKGIYNTAVEATVGTLEGAALLPGVDSLLGAIGESETGYGNFLSDIFADVKEGMKADVYQTQQAREGFAPMDGSWWASNADTIASTLTLMIPAMGMTKLLGAVGKISKMAAMRNGLVTTETLINNANAINKIEKVGGILGASAIQRWTENTMEAQGTFEDTYQSALQMGMSDDVAREKAGNAAAKTWGAGWANMAQDVFQFGTIGRGIGKFSSRSAKALAAQAAKSMPRRGAEAVGRVGLTMGSEALEEADQYVISQESKKSELEDDYKFSGLYDRLVNDYIKDPEFHTSMFFGAIGGGVFKAAGDVIENRIDKRNQQVVKERKEKLQAILNDDYVKDNGLDASLIFNKTMAYIEMEALDDLKDNINLEVTKSDAELQNEGYATQEERDFYRKKLTEGLEDIDFIADTHMNSSNQFRDPLVVRTEVAMEYNLRKLGRSLKTMETDYSKLVSDSLAADASQEQLTRVADIDRVSTLRKYYEVLKDKEGSKQVKNPQEVKTFIKERLKTLTDEIKTRLPEGMDMETYLKHDKDTAISNREMHTKNIDAQESSKILMEDFRNELELTKGNKTEVIAERARQAVLNKTKDDIRSSKMSPEVMVDNGILEGKDKSFNEFLDTVIEQQDTTDVPTGEKREDKIQKRYAGKNLLFVKEMKEMFSSGINNTDAPNLESFVAKYTSDKKFKADVDTFYDNKAKELGTFYDTTDLIIEEKNDVINPETFGADIISTGVPVSEQNLIDSLHVALVRYNKEEGMVYFQGYNDQKPMTIQDYKLEHSGNYLYEGWTPVYMTDGSMVPNAFNQFTDRNGDTVTIVSDEAHRILNDPTIQFTGQSIRYKVYPDHPVFNPTNKPSNFLIGVEVEHNGEWITVGRLTAKEKFNEAKKIRAAVLEHYKRTGETSVDIGSKVTKKQNGFIRRNPKATEKNKQPYHTVLGNDTILGVILPDGNGSFEIKYGQLKDSASINVDSSRDRLARHVGDTVALVRQANGSYIPTKLFTRKAKDVKDPETDGTMADKAISKLEAYHNSEHTQEDLDFLYSEMDPIIYLRIQRTKDGNYKYLEQKKGKANWSEEVTFADLKKYVKDTKGMRVDMSRINDPRYNSYLQKYNILETDIAPNDTIIGASLAIDLTKKDTRTEEQKAEDKKNSTAKVPQKPNVENTEIVQEFSIEEFADITNTEEEIFELQKKRFLIENYNTVVSINGIEGVLSLINEYRIEIETNDSIFEISINDITSFEKKYIKELEKNVKYNISEINENTVIVNNIKYIINTDNKGNIISLNPENNPSQNITNNNLVLAVEIERNKIEVNNQSTIENSTVSKELKNNNYNNLDLLLNTIYEINFNETVEQGLSNLYSSKSLTENEKLQVGLWLQDSFDRLSKLFNKNNTSLETETLLNAYDTLEIILSLLYDRPLKQTTKNYKNEKINNVGKIEVTNSSERSKREVTKDKPKEKINSDVEKLNIEIDKKQKKLNALKNQKNKPNVKTTEEVTPIQDLFPDDELGILNEKLDAGSVEAKKADIEKRRQKELNNSITDKDKVIFGHPTIGKSFLKKQGEDKFITLDDDYANEVNAFVDANRGSETRQEYKGRKPKEYNEFMLNLYDRLKAQAQKEGKILFVSNTNILKERMSDFDKVITIPKEEFKRRFDERGATYGFEDWKSDIDATVSKVNKSKVISTTGYLANLFQDKINAKYDAELATLEETKAEEVKNEEPNINDSKFDIFGDTELYRTKEGVTDRSPITESDKEWFAKYYPEYSPQVVDDLSTVTRKGGTELYGMFRNGIIYLSSDAATGTLRHEAFHLVFNSMLTDKERKDILTQQRYRKEKDISKTATDIDVEETLADEFMDVKLTGGEIINTFTGKIKDFFKRLWNIAQIFLERKGLRQGPSIDTLFYRVNRGLYNNFPKFQRNVTRFRKNIYGDLSVSEAKMASQIIASNLVNNFIGVKLREYYNMPDADTIDILKRANTYLNPKKRKKGDEGKNGYDFNDLLLGGVYPALNRARAVTTNEIDRNNLTRIMNALAYVDDTGRPRLRNLRNLVAGELQNYGIKTSVSNLNDTVATYLVEDEDGVADEHTDESFDFKDRFTSSLKDFRAASRVLFASIPNTKRQFAGFGLYHEPSTVYNTLKKALESSLSVEDMMNKLERLYINHPDYRVISDNFFTNDRTLITDFYLNFGQRNNTPFIKIITNKDNSKTVFESNRSNVTSDLRSDWMETFLTSSEYYDVSNGTIVNYKKAEKVVADIDSFVKELITVDTLNDTQATTFIDFLRDAGIRQDSDTIRRIVTSKGGSAIVRTILKPTKDKGLQSFYGTLSRGSNPFEVSDETEGENSSLEMSKILNTISYNLSQMFPEMRSSMFQNGKGKSVDSNLLPRDSMRRLLRWKSNPESIDMMGSDPFWSQSKFLGIEDYLNSGIFRNRIQDVQLAIFDTSESGKNNHREYSELTAKNFHTSLINLFFNYNKQGTENEMGWFGMPIPSDSTAYNIIRFPKSGTIKAIEYIVDAVNNETMRIKWLDKIISDNQEAYNEWMKLSPKEQKSNKPEAFKDIPFNMILNGRKYHTFPELNEGDRAKSFSNYNEFSQAVKKAYEGYKVRFYQDLVDKNVLEYDSKSDTYKILDEDLDKRISEVKEDNKKKISAEELRRNIDRFLANATLVNIQTAFLFAGDIANYKNVKNTGDVSVEDFFKRVKQINSPGTYLNPDAEFVNAEGTVIKGRKEYRVAVIADHDKLESVNLEKILSIQEDHVRNVLGYSDSEVKAHLKFIRSKYSDMNITDAFTAIDPYRYREIAIQSGKWSMVKEDIYHRIMKNEDIAPNEMEIFQPFKPFKYSMESVNNIHIPTQHKNAEILITPQMAKYNSVYKTLFEKMGYTFKEDGSFTFDEKGRDANEYIDAGMYNSSVKVGELRTFTNEESIVPSETQLFNNEDYRIQMGTPEHFVDALINIGSQVRKLIIEEFDTNSDKTYVINGLNDGQPMTAKEIINRYNELLSKNLEDSYNDVKSIFKNEDGTLNRDRMVEELKKFIIERELGTDYLEAVELIDGGPSIPYWYPTISYNLQAIFSAFYKNNITKQQMKGMALFNSSSVGYNAEGVIRKPKIVFGKDGNIDHIEALIPAHNNKLMSKEFIDPATGLIDVKKVEAFDERLLKGVFYRIPSEDKYSIVHIKVIGFLPNSSGAQIILPDEITTMAGLDFDIDKMFGMMYEMDSDGRTVESSMDTRKGRNNMMLDMMYGIMQLKETAARQLSPGNFDNLVDVKDDILSITQEDSSLNFASQNSKVEVQQRNMMGKELIGVFANHRVNHILFTFGDFALKEPIRFNGKSLSSLSDRVSQYDNKPIGQRLATFVAAVVDNAKDPIASMLNLVPFLSDTAAMMIRVGYSELTVGRFLKQKVFLDLTNDFTNSSEFGSIAVMKLLKEQIKNIEDTEQLSADRQKELRRTDITDEILKQNLIKPDNRINWILLDKMLTMYEQAEALRKMMSTMRYDSTGKAAGPTYFDTQAKVMEYDKISTSEESLITGYKDFMTNEDLKWVRDFYKLGVKNSLSDMLEVMELPYENGVFSNTKDYFNFWKPVGTMKATELSMLTNAVFTVNAASFKPFGIERSMDIIKKFPDRFQKFKNTYSDSRYSLITQMITVENAKSSDTRFGVPFKMLKFNRQGITPSHMQSIRDQWTEMMESENEEIRNFAQDLAAYTFFTSGFMFRKNSLNDAIPVTWMTTMTDENGKTFLQHIKDMNNSNSLNQNQIEEIVRNIYQSMDIFPEIELKGSGVEVVKKEKSGLYEGGIISNDRSFVKTIDKEKIYSPYVRLRLIGDIRLLKLDRVEDSVPYYKEIQPLGVHNRYVQFSNGDTVIKGVIPIGVSKIVGTEFLKPIETSSISEITNHSGGAIGSDTQWDVIGKEFGMINNKHYWTETKTPLGNSEISKEDFEEGRYESAKAAKRNFGYQYQTMKDSRLIRNWSQVKHSDSIFAIGKIVGTGEKLFPKQSYDTRVAVNPSVTGGTGYAVGMGINHNKPVYVFNQSDSQKYSIGWYEWDNKSKDFVKVDVPILTKDFAGIGTREINDLGKQAIRDVYQKFLNQLKEQPVTETVEQPIVVPEKIDEGILETIEIAENVPVIEKEETMIDTTKTFSHKGIDIDIEIDLSTDQREALSGLIDFLNDRNTKSQYKTLVGPAGTGKTTIIAYLEKYMKKKGYVFNYMAPTHAATVELAFSIVKTGNKNLPATVRSSIYYNTFMKTFDFTKKIKDRLSFGYNTIVVDESSMLDEQDTKDLLQAAELNGIKVIFMGDPMQIPKPDTSNPLKKKIPSIFNNLNSYKLNTIHRQKSGDMRDLLSKMRNVNSFKLFKPTVNNDRLFFTGSQTEFEKRLKDSVYSNPENTVYISYTNAAVKSMNSKIRNLHGRVGQTVPGDIVIGYLGYGNYQIERGNVANSISYTINTISKKDSSYNIETLSDKLQDLIDSGIATIKNNKAYAQYYPLSNNDSLKFDDTTVEDFNKNNSKLADIFGTIHRAGIAYNNKQIVYKKYVDIVTTQGEKLQTFYIGNDYVYNPTTDRMELYDKQNPVHSKLKTSGQGSLLMNKSIDYGHAITIHKSQGSTHQHVFFDSSVIDKAKNIEIFTPEGVKMTVEAQTLAYVGMSRASNSLTVYEANNEFEKINVDNTEPVSQKFVNEFRSLQMSIGEFLADQKEKTTMTMTEAVDSFESYSNNPKKVTKEEFDMLTLDRKLANWFSYKNCK